MAHLPPHEAERGYELLANVLPQLIWSARADGEVDYCNQRWCDYTGLTFEQFRIGGWMQVVHPDEAALTRERWTQAGASRTAFEVEHRLRRRDGEYRWHLTHAYPHLDDARNIVRWFGTCTDVEASKRTAIDLERQLAELDAAVVRDITQRKELEENLARARDQALEASRLKSEFLASVSHEIRTPMNGIIGMTNLLLEREQPPAEREMMRVIQTSAESLLRLLNDLLDFSKIEARKLRIEHAEFELQPVIEETLALLAPRAREKDLELTCHFEPRLARAFIGDAGRVRQVLMNLVGNAIKFTDHGHITVEARCVHESAQRTRFRVLVRDSGPGIPVEAQAGLFEPFTQLDASVSRRYGGAGLGLAISRQLVELMGGTIGLQSDAGKGATFWFELELKHRAETRCAPEALPDLAATLRVLVVDAAEASRERLLAQIRKLGVTAGAAASGADALASLRHHAAVGVPWHVVLTDAQLPQMSALQLAIDVRADEGLAATPLGMLSAPGALEDPTVAAAAGFEAFLTRPISDSQLHRCLGRLGARADTAGLNARSPVRPAEPASSADARALHVLLAEDNPANQMVAQMLLAKLGHTVEIASNGREALARLSRQSFDAVLMDCQMPVLDGYETTRRIRSGHEPGVNPQLPVIALTAYALPDDRRKCLAAGMNDYVAKPVRLRELRDALARCAVADGEKAAATSPAITRDAAGNQGHLAVLDPVVLNRMRALRGRHGTSLLPELVRVFETDAPRRLAEIHRLAAAQRAEELVSVAHALAGSCASIGGIRMQHAALAVEHVAKQGAWSALPAELRALDAAWAHMQVALREQGQQVR